MSGLGNMPLWLNGLFASPWMLLWLPAVVVPLVIHLLYRQRYREISWAAMEYLLAAIEKRARRMRVLSRSAWPHREWQLGVMQFFI